MERWSSQHYNLLLAYILCLSREKGHRACSEEAALSDGSVMRCVMAGAWDTSYIIEELTAWHRRNCAGGSRTEEGHCISSWSIKLYITSANWDLASSFSLHDASLFQTEHVITPEYNVILHTPVRNQFPISFDKLLPCTCFCRHQLNPKQLLISQNSCTAHANFIIYNLLLCGMNNTWPSAEKAHTLHAR